MKKEVAVIAGAGPAGLTAAYELLQRTQVQPLVFESTDAIGGIAQTFNYKGNRIDIGGHRFFSKSERVMDWWFNILPLQGAPAADTVEKDHHVDYATEALVRYLCPECAPAGVPLDGNVSRRPAPDPETEDDVMLQRPRTSRIFYHRHFFPYPLAFSLRVARKLGLWNTTLIGASFIKSKLFPLRDEAFLDAFFINRFGRRLYETFFKDYTEKVWGVPCSEIRAEWGAQRIKGLDLRRAVVTAVQDLVTTQQQREQAERETSLITRFYYPKYGPGQMWETVAHHVQVAGGEVQLRRRISGVHLEGGRVAAVDVRNLETGAVTREPCDYFFSTMPVQDLVRMFSPQPPEPVRRVAEGLQYRDFMTVGLLVKRLHVRTGGAVVEEIPDNWIYVQDSDVRVGRVQVFNNWSPYMVADRENTVWIGLEYFVNEGDDLWTTGDEELVRFGTSELEKIGIIRGEDVLDGCVLRMPKAYPAYFGTYDEIDTIRDYVDQIPNLFLIGRNGMHRYNNQDHSMLTAMLAVDNIAAGEVDKQNLWDVNTERVYHEEKKGE